MMNASFRTAFWAMCLGLTVPMMLFVGVRLATDGRGGSSQQSLVSASAESLQSRWKREPPASAADELGKSLKAPGRRSGPQPADRQPPGPKVRLIPQVEPVPSREDAPDLASTAVTLDSKLEPDPIADGPRPWPTRVTALPTAARPQPDSVSANLPPLTTSPDERIESQLDEILRHLGRLAVEIESRRGTLDPALRPPSPETRIYRPRHVSVRALESLASPLLTKGVGRVAATADKSESSPADAALVVQDFPAVLARIDRLVRELDVPPPQIALEATILTVRLDSSMPYGIDLGRFGGGQARYSIRSIELKHGTGMKSGILSGDAKAFVQEFRGAVPVRRATALQLTIGDRQVADLNLSDAIPAAGQTPAAGMTIRIRPFVTREGLISLEIRGGSPDASPTSAGHGLSNSVTLQRGESAVLGGFVAERMAAALDPKSDEVGPPLTRPRQTEPGAPDRLETIVLLTPQLVDGPIPPEVVPISRTTTDSAAAGSTQAWSTAPTPESLPSRLALRPEEGNVQPPTAATRSIDSPTGAKPRPVRPEKATRRRRSPPLDQIPTVPFPVDEPPAPVIRPAEPGGSDDLPDS